MMSATRVRLRPVLAAAFAALVVLLQGCGGGRLDVRVENDTEAVIRGLSLISGEGTSVPIPEIAPGDSFVTTPALGPGEGHLLLEDQGGRRYEILPYFEGNPGGEVSVEITASAEEGLEGTVDDRSRYSSAGEYPLRRAE
jgi:hypothetical protein